MAFQGSLAELHLPDIIQLVSVSGKTGIFHLTDGTLKGQIFLNDGKIVHALLEDASGEEAVYALAIWRQGEFRFDPGPATEQRTISKSNTNLLMEAARRLDEWRVLSKKIPSVDLVPEFVIQDNREGQINLNTSEWLILSKIDGQRTGARSSRVGRCRMRSPSAPAGLGRPRRLDQGPVAQEDRVPAVVLADVGAAVLAQGGAQPILPHQQVEALDELVGVPVPEPRVRAAAGVPEHRGAPGGEGGAAEGHP